MKTVLSIEGFEKPVPMTIKIESIKFREIPSGYEELELLRQNGRTIQWLCPITGWRDIGEKHFKWILRPDEYRAKPLAICGNEIRYGSIPDDVNPPNGFEFNIPIDGFVSVRRLSDGSNYYVEWDGEQIKKLVRKGKASLWDVIRTKIRSWVRLQFKGGFKLGQEYYDERDTIHVSIGDTLFSPEADRLFER